MLHWFPKLSIIVPLLATVWWCSCPELSHLSLLSCLYMAGESDAPNYYLQTITLLQVEPLLRSCSVQITYVDILGLPAQLTYQRMFLYSLQGREEYLMRPHIRNREVISPSRFQRFVMIDSISNVFAASILLGTLHMDCCLSWSSLNLEPEPSVSALHGLTCYKQCKTFTKQFIRAIHKAWNSF